MTELLAHGTVVLGGLSNALEDRGHDLSSDLWTARLLRDDPGRDHGGAPGLLRGRGPTEAATTRGASACAAPRMQRRLSLLEELHSLRPVMPPDILP